MTLFERVDFDGFATELAGVTLVDQWESRVAKVGDKVFAVLNDDGAKIAFKVSEESFEILTALEARRSGALFRQAQMGRRRARCAAVER